MTKWIVALTAALFISVICAGCSHKTASTTTRAEAVCQGKSEHKAAHGGSLNAIVTCENGHAEVKIDGDKLQLWLVGGGSNTGESVRIPDSSVQIKVETDSGAKTLVLNPKPLELAGEKVGDCSYFEGIAPWLRGLARFTAEGQITFKGQKTPLRIEYPKGYDPD